MSRSERLLIYAALALTLLLPGVPSGCDRLRAAAPPAKGDPPTLDIKDSYTATAAGYVAFKPATTAVSIIYIGLSGQEPFPMDVIGGNPLAFVLFTRGLPDGSYKFAAVAASATGEQVRKDFAVVVGTPGPPVPPTPPTPADPLTAVLQTAYDADAGPTKAAALATLADIHAGAADLAGQPTITTFGQLAGAVHTVAAGKLGDKPGGQLLGVRAAIGAEEAKVFAGTTATPLTASNRADLQKWYARVSAALKGVKP